MPLPRPIHLLSAVILAGCGHSAQYDVADGTGPDPLLPEPDSSIIPTVNVAPAVGWSAGASPAPAEGTIVHRFAEGLEHPRWLYVLPNGDVLVAESNAPAQAGKEGTVKSWFMKKMKKKAGAAVPSADRITLLRDENGDGAVDLRTTFLEHLHSPFGMALVGNDFYVADTDAVLRFPYRYGATRIDAPGSEVMSLPAGEINRHWTRNLLADPGNGRLFVTVGSNSDHGENGMETEAGRAAIWVLDLKTGTARRFATGLRNPNGLAFEQQTRRLWTTVAERDELGSDLVPDFLTSVKEGGFYGWPYSYFGRHVDNRISPQRPDMVARAITPDYALGPHTTSLGLASSAGSNLPAPFYNGMFVGQHGSWNRKPYSGYKVVFVPFADGKPAGPPVDVLTGFLSSAGEARGRPVGVAVDKTGSLLVADDVGNIVWRLSAAPGTPPRP